jgi:hypothetical protein
MEEANQRQLIERSYRLEAAEAAGFFSFNLSLALSISQYKNVRISLQFLLESSA